MDGKVPFVFNDSILISSSSSILAIKPSRESLKRFLTLEKELKRMSADVFDDAEEISSVVVDAEKGKLIRCRLKEPLDQKDKREKEKEKENHKKVRVTLRLVGVRLTRMVSELIWDFVKSEEIDSPEKTEDKNKKNKKKCEIPDSDSEEGEEDQEKENENDDCIGDAIEDLRSDLLETLTHKLLQAKRDMDHIQLKLIKFQEWQEELSGKNVSLDTIEHISAQPEMSQ